MAFPLLSLAIMSARKLPHQGTSLYLTAGSLETTMLYEAGLDFPEFASFTLLSNPKAIKPMTDFYRNSALIAMEYSAGIVFSTPTWRASRDWGAKLAYSPQEITSINHESVSFLQSIRSQPDLRDAKVLLSGCVGPRGDGYVVGVKMGREEAAEYHYEQVAALASAGVDLVSGMTFNYTEEAIGLSIACQRANIPVVISLTLEIDGSLPDGEPLQTAIEAIDTATGAFPAYYMLNCCHPSHFSHLLNPAFPWVQRIQGIQANSSMKSHAELANSTVLDSGEPLDLAQGMYRLKEGNGQLMVLGGCCGTDFRHIRLIAQLCSPLFLSP